MYVTWKVFNRYNFEFKYVDILAIYLLKIWTL